MCIFTTGRRQLEVDRLGQVRATCEKATGKDCNGLQKEKRYGKVKILQHILVTSFDANALAVKWVTSNKGKRTAGVDKVKWTTAAVKFKAIPSLSVGIQTKISEKSIH